MSSSINLPVYSDALVVLGTAGVIVPLMLRWRINPVLGYLLAGMCLGPLGLGAFTKDIPALYWFTITDAGNLSGLADLGVVFLLFLIGLELSFERLMAMRRLVFGLGSLQVLLSSCAIAAVLIGLNTPIHVAAILACSLALSSTAIVLEILSSRARLQSQVGRTSFAVLLAQDLAVIPILMFISVLGVKTDASILNTVTLALLQTISAVLIIFLVGRAFLRPLFRQVARTQSSELFIAAILFVIVGTGMVATAFNLSMALGAFIAGLLLAETEFNKAIESTISPFKGLLLGLFFFSVGMGVNIRELLQQPTLLLTGVLALILIKSVIMLFLARLFRQSLSVALETGLLLGPGGEFAFVAIGLAVTLGIVPPQIGGIAIAVTSISMMLIPALAALGRKMSLAAESRAFSLNTDDRPPPAYKQHAIVVGYGRVGKVVCLLLKQHNLSYTAADHNAASVAEDRRRGHDVYYGDATDPEFLKVCGLMDAAALIVTIHTQVFMERIISEVRRLRPDIPIIARARDAAHAAHLYELGATDAVPETVEASLQLSEAALLRLGILAGPVIATIHEQRDVYRQQLQSAVSGVKPTNHA